MCNIHIFDRWKSINCKEHDASNNMARDCNCLFIHDILRFLLRRGKLVISVTIRRFPPRNDAQFIYPRLSWN